MKKKPTPKPRPLPVRVMRMKYHIIKWVQGKLLNPFRNSIHAAKHRMKIEETGHTYDTLEEAQAALKTEFGEAYTDYVILPVYTIDYENE